MTPESFTGHLLDLLQRNDTNRIPADRLISRYFQERRYLGATDRRMLSEDFFGIIRNRRLLEAFIERFVDTHPAHAILDHPPERYLTLVACYRLSRQPAPTAGEQVPHWNTRFPEVDFAGFAAFVRGHLDLKFLGEDERVRLGVRYSFQDWMVEEWSTLFGSETEALLSAMNLPAPTSIRVNTLKTSAEECRKILAGAGVETVASRFAADALIAGKRFNRQAIPQFSEGYFEMQDEGSQMISVLAGAQPGMTVIDACAGAGGKSLHLAALMCNKGEIIAIDTERSRLHELNRRAQRSGATAITTVPYGELIPENLRSKADLVLVDAPCSGSGTIRRNPWFKWTIDRELVDRYAAAQGQILAFNAQFVKPGGTLMYVTCSLFRKENDAVIDRFLKDQPAFVNTTADTAADHPSVSVRAGVAHLLPHVHGTDGFTLCVMRRPR